MAAAKDDNHDNGRGIKLPFKISDFLHGASSVVSIVVVLIGLVVWSAKQEGRIGELEHRITAQTQQLAEIEQRGTRGAAERISIMSEHVDANNAAIGDMQKRLDQFNNAGSQAGLLLAERVANDERQMNAIRDQLRISDDDFSKRIAAHNLDTQKIHGHLDLVDAEMKRVSEQQARILQAIDSTYNLIQEHLRNGGQHNRPQ